MVPYTKNVDPRNEGSEHFGRLHMEARYQMGTSLCNFGRSRSKQVDKISISSGLALAITIGD